MQGRRWAEGALVKYICIGFVMEVEVGESMWWPASSASTEIVVVLKLDEAHYDMFVVVEAAGCCRPGASLKRASSAGGLASSGQSWGGCTRCLHVS